MRSPSGHLPINEKVLAGKVAVCLLFCAVEPASGAFRAHQGHIAPQSLRPLVASRRRAWSPQQPHGGAIALAGVRHRPRPDARPWPSLSQQQPQGGAFSIMSPARRGDFFRRGEWGPAYPRLSRPHSNAGSATAPRRKFKTSLTTLAIGSA